MHALSLIYLYARQRSFPANKLEYMYIAGLSCPINNSHSISHYTLYIVYIHCTCRLITVTYKTKMYREGVAEDCCML